MNGEQEQSLKLEDFQANAAVRGILSDGLVSRWSACSGLALKRLS